MKAKILTAALVLPLLIAFAAGCQGTPPPPRTPSPPPAPPVVREVEQPGTAPIKKVEATHEGAAVIEKNNIEAAKTAAINNALMAALEQRYGPLAAAEMRLNNFDLMRNRLIKDPRIFKYTVVSAEHDGKLYRVKIRITFSSDAATVSNMYQLKISLDIAESGPGGKPFTDKLESLILGENLGCRLLSGAKDADVIISGTASTKEHSSSGSESTCRADVVIRLHRKISGEPVTTAEAHVVGLPRYSASDAARSACDAAAKKVFAKVRDALIFKRTDIIERLLVIDDVENVGVAQRILSALGEIPGITLVEQKYFDDKANRQVVLVRMTINSQWSFTHYVEFMKKMDLEIMRNAGGVIFIQED